MKSFVIVLILVISSFLPFIAFYAGYEVVKSNHIVRSVWYTPESGPGWGSPREGTTGKGTAFLIISIFTLFGLMARTLLIWGLKEWALYLIGEPYKPINWKEVLTFDYWQWSITACICILFFIAFIVFIFLFPSR